MPCKRRASLQHFCFHIFQTTRAVLSSVTSAATATITTTTITTKTTATTTTTAAAAAAAATPATAVGATRAPLSTRRRPSEVRAGRHNNNSSNNNRNNNSSSCCCSRCGRPRPKCFSTFRCSCAARRACASGCAPTPPTATRTRCHLLVIALLFLCLGLVWLF